MTAHAHYVIEHRVVLDELSECDRSQCEGRRLPPIIPEEER